MQVIQHHNNMKAIEINGEIKIFNTLPSTWNGKKHYMAGFEKSPIEVLEEEGFYDVVNLHNPKTVYAKGISNHKLAVAVGIMYGKNTKVDMMYITKVDHEYWHHMSNIIQYRYSSEMALKNGDEIKSEIVLSRADYHLDALQPIKRQVNSILNDAEKLLFDNK